MQRLAASLLLPDAKHTFFMTRHTKETALLLNSKDSVIQKL